MVTTAVLFQRSISRTPIFTLVGWTWSIHRSVRPWQVTSTRRTVSKPVAESSSAVGE
ncbi:MAG: hypothetical protein ACLT1W_09475 [Alistipes onderdonkii]